MCVAIHVRFAIVCLSLRASEGPDRLALEVGREFAFADAECQGFGEAPFPDHPVGATGALMLGASDAVKRVRLSRAAAYWLSIPVTKPPMTRRPASLRITRSRSSGPFQDGSISVRDPSVDCTAPNADLIPLIKPSMIDFPAETSHWPAPAKMLVILDGSCCT